MGKEKQKRRHKEMKMEQNQKQKDRNRKVNRRRRQLEKKKKVNNKRITPEMKAFKKKEKKFFRERMRIPPVIPINKKKERIKKAGLEERIKIDPLKMHYNPDHLHSNMPDIDITHLRCLLECLEELTGNVIKGDKLFHSKNLGLQLKYKFIKNALNGKYLVDWDNHDHMILIEKNKFKVKIFNKIKNYHHCRLYKKTLSKHWVNDLGERVNYMNIIQLARDNFAVALSDVKGSLNPKVKEFKIGSSSPNDDYLERRKKTSYVRRSSNLPRFVNRSRSASVGGRGRKSNERRFVAKNKEKNFNFSKPRSRSRAKPPKNFMRRVKKKNNGGRIRFKQNDRKNFVGPNGNNRRNSRGSNKTINSNKRKQLFDPKSNRKVKMVGFNYQ